MRDRLLLIAFFFSGVSALGFELFWVRLLGLGLGSEAYGVLAVLAGFFGGLCLGAAALHRVVITARHPVRLYAISEALIASYGLLSPWLLLGAVDTLPTFVGTVVGDNQSTLALALNLAIAALLLLPATVPMGVTTAALVEVWRRFHSDGDARYGVGRLYAANTLGATVGIVWSTYWLFPRVGSVTAVAVLAAQCLIAAFTAVYSHRMSASSGAAPVRPEPPRPTDRSTAAVYAVLSPPGSRRSASRRSEPRSWRKYSRTPSTRSRTSSPCTWLVHRSEPGYTRARGRVVSASCAIDARARSSMPLPHPCLLPRFSWT